MTIQYCTICLECATVKAKPIPLSPNIMNQTKWMLKISSEHSIHFTHMIVGMVAEKQLETCVETLFSLKQCICINTVRGNNWHIVMKLAIISGLHSHAWSWKRNHHTYAGVHWYRLHRTHWKGITSHTDVVAIALQIHLCTIKCGCWSFAYGVYKIAKSKLCYK